MVLRYKDKMSMSMEQHQFIKQVGNYIIQAIPCCYGCVEEHGLFGMEWKAMVYMDFTKTDYIDNKINSYSTHESFNTPEDAIAYAELLLEDIKEKLNKEHTTGLNKYILPIEDFKKKLKKNDGCVKILTIKEYTERDFYTDDYDYTAYAVYGDKVFTYFGFCPDEITDDEPFDEIKDNKLSMIELAAQTLGCNKEDITTVLFVDYPENK